MKVRRNPIEQVIKYTVTLPTDCWSWVGPKRAGGYGRIKLDGKKDVLAHRWVYELLRGPIPRGLVIDHLCRNRTCVNPQHMEPVTARENTKRGDVGWRRYVVQCIRGHPLEGDNLFIAKSGKRSCRSCRRAAKRKWVAKMRAVGAPSDVIGGRRSYKDWLDSREVQ